MPESLEQPLGEDQSESVIENEQSLEEQKRVMLEAREASRNLMRSSKRAVHEAHIMLEKGPRDRMVEWTGSASLKDTVEELEEALRIVKEISAFPRDHHPGGMLKLSKEEEE